MKGLICWLVFIQITIHSTAQNLFDYNGRLFITDILGYKTTLSGYYRHGSTDDLLSLPQNGLSLGGSLQYYFHTNWGIYSDIQYDEHYGRARDNQAGEKLATDYYKPEYYPGPFHSANGSRNKKSLRLVLGPSYSIEQERFFVRVGLGLGITRFEAVQTTGIIKKKGGNQLYKIEFTNAGVFRNPAPFTIQTHLQFGYRWHRRWATSITGKIASFNPGFDYELQRTDLYTQQVLVDRTISYHQRIYDLNWGLGITYIVHTKDRKHM